MVLVVVIEAFFSGIIIYCKEQSKFDTVSLSKDQISSSTPGICLSTMIFNINDFNNLLVYGHLFTPNETATFVGVLDQVQAELELVVANLENNNMSLAQSHVIKASSLLTPKIMSEITEDNPRLTDDLRRALS